MARRRFYPANSLDFSGAGAISEEGRSGEFEQAVGRVAMIDGTVGPTAGTFDAAYELIVERTDK